MLAGRDVPAGSSMPPGRLVPAVTTKTVGRMMPRGRVVPPGRVTNAAIVVPLGMVVVPWPALSGMSPSDALMPAGRVMPPGEGFPVSRWESRGRTSPAAGRATAPTRTREPDGRVHPGILARTLKGREEMKVPEAPRVHIYPHESRYHLAAWEGN